MNIFFISLVAGIIILSVAMILCFVRFYIGPTLPDRVTAFDLIAAHFIAITCMYAVITDNKGFMDVAIVLSLVAFLGAMSFAYYLRIRRKTKQQETKKEKPNR